MPSPSSSHGELGDAHADAPKDVPKDVPKDAPKLERLHDKA